MKKPKETSQSRDQRVQAERDHKRVAKAWNPHGDPRDHKKNRREWKKQVNKGDFP